MDLGINDITHQDVPMVTPCSQTFNHADTQLATLIKHPPDNLGTWMCGQIL